MSIKRVQKLLFSEYCDFEDMVLIESPFAQTTREGTGLRQVHLGLTPSKLVLATDVLPPVEKSCVSFLPGIDPDIETFELIAIYPIDCVNLSVFRRRKRQAIKAHFCNRKVFYFELGGFENRTMFWNLWCEKIKFLSPESGSSHSETSVATSSTNSTLYLVDSKQVVKPNGLTQVWCKFGTSKDEQANLAAKWTDRHLFLGKNFEDYNYKPVMTQPSLSQFVKKRKNPKFSVSIGNSEFREVHIGDSYQIHRFGDGVKENCASGLFLPAENYIVPRRFSQTSEQSSALYDELASKSFDTILEDCVRFWEVHRDLRYRQSRKRHKRRYGIAPQPLFLYGLGPWNINSGAKYSIQVKRAVSEVGIRRQPVDSEMRLPVTKRQLVATISCETLLQDETKKNNNLSCGGPRRPVIFFWTPDYWYRPRSARDAYQELQTHLKNLQEYHQKSKKRRRLFRRRPPPRSDSSDAETDQSPKYQKFKKRRSLTRFGLTGRAWEVCDVEEERKDDKETALQYLKRLLKVNVVLTAWDFDSATLAQQLTMVDRDLFLKISAIELGVLVSQQSSKNAPNVAAMVAFSHRISCLVASDVLKSGCERTRARLIARFIAVAEKCHRISNFQSCRTILLGLQSPAIYRLKATWAYLRKKHASKYQTFEFLCRLYRDPRLLNYQKTFLLSSQTTPYLPFIGDVIAKLLDRIPNYKIKTPRRVKSSPKMSTPSEKDSGLFTKLLMSMKLINFNNYGSDSELNEGRSNQVLCSYYKPLDCYEDNRVKCLSETTEFLQKCQLSALNYNFAGNKLAMDYLLKARYKEERDNFFESFNIEPKENS